MRIVVSLLALVSSTLVVTQAHAQTESLEHIRVSVQHFLETQTRHYEVEPRIEVGHLDNRLRLARCGTQLAPFFPSGSRKIGHITVGVRCESPKPWTVYISASAKVFREVAVLNRSLQRGASLTPEHVVLEERDIGTLFSGYYGSLDEVVGLTAKRALPTGQVLTPSVVALPKLVHRGQQITLIAGADSIEVRSRGKALSDGVAGELISVKNLSSNRVVEGVVLEAGLVKILM